MKSKKVILVKDEYFPFVWVQDADSPWAIDPKIDHRNKIVEIPEVLFQDYQVTLDLVNGLRDRLMKYYEKGQS